MTSIKVKQIFKTSTSVTFELDNNEAYYAHELYDVYLDNLCVLKNVRENIFSLFNLSPKTHYKLNVFGEDLLFTTDEESAVINVLDYGAKPDGKTDNSIAFQRAIIATPKQGRLHIPKGTYVISPIFLKSNIAIELSLGTTLLGHTDRLKYPILPARIFKNEKILLELSSWEGMPHATRASLITGINVENVMIYGQGHIDMNAHNSDWWINPKSLKENAYRAKGVFLSHCQNIKMQGLTLSNSPSWNIHPYFSSDLDFIDLKINNPKNSPNTDGLNPESSKNVNVVGVKFSVGDDCIAIKSGKYYMGLTYKTPSENITIRNCLMQHGHGAIVLGSEMSGGIKHLSIKQCYFNATDRGLRIKTRRGRGSTGVIDGVVFENIIMDNVLTPLVMNMYYFCDPDGKTEYVYSKNPLPKDERTPYLGSFTFKNMICKNVSVAAGFFYGLPEQPIESIHLENIHFTYNESAQQGIPVMMSFLEPMKKQGLQFRYVNHVSLKQVTLNGHDGAEIFLEHVKTFDNNIGE